MFRTFYFVRNARIFSPLSDIILKKKTRANLITSNHLPLHVQHDILIRKEAFTFDMPKNNTSINDNYCGKLEVLVHPKTFFVLIK